MISNSIKIEKRGTLLSWEEFLFSTGDRLSPVDCRGFIHVPSFVRECNAFNVLHIRNTLNNELKGIIAIYKDQSDSSKALKASIIF